LGWIPEEWSIKEFGKFASVSKTKYVPSESENRKCIELEHINQEAGSINGYVSSANQKSTKNAFKKGQVLFGKLRPYLKKYWLADFDGVCSSEVWVLQANSQDCCNEYLFRIVQQHRFIQVANVSSGSKMPRADWDFVAEFPFALPTSPERKIIAAILSTWDEAITKTQQLIAQLQQRNKGLMQQLLTGKKRLKGFEGEWKKVELGSLGDSYNGLTGKAKDDFGSGSKFIKYLTIFNNLLITSTEEFGLVRIQNGENQNEVKYGDIFFTVSSETPEEVGMSSVLLIDVPTCYLNSFCFGFRLFDFKTLNPVFASFLLRSEVVRKEIVKLAQGSTRFNLSKFGIKKLLLALPEISEQELIAEACTWFIDEVKIHEQKLSALQQQKKGLMQKLLTGEVRVKLSEKD
jgi:type I restriction enzyme S subunit